MRHLSMGTVILGLAIAGCAAPYSRENITAPDASERASAIRAAADNNDQDAIPQLVDRLEDDDEAVRFYAINALDRLTGQRLGYVFYRAPQDQVDSIQRWREWLVTRNVEATIAAPDSQTAAGTPDVGNNQNATAVESPEAAMDQDIAQ